ncbi:MAG TPA: ABC transporter ATP-binding protein [Candidatus Limnocylindria bacterium]|nr:ABC transporter ATP-binding protein [Candidatus Limnocylindria bacterium]
MAAAIEATGVRKRFGDVEALTGVDLHVAPGTIYGLLGPNGAGKTTLIRALVGLVKPDAGELNVLGTPMPNRSLLDRIGYMTQAAALYGDLSAEQNVSFFASILGGGDVEAALRFVDLWERRRSLVSTLSGGMRTRLSLACTIVHRPRLLLLDEPTVGVDPQLRVQLWDGLRHMAADGATILVSSHVMDEAERCDRLGLMLGGRLLAEGTVAELLALAGTDRLEDAFLKLEARAA